MSAAPKRGSVHPFADGWLRRAAVRIETAPSDDLPGLVAKTVADLQRLRSRGVIASDVVPLRLARALRRRRVAVSLELESAGR